MLTIRNLSWEEFLQDAESLARRIQTSRQQPFKAIIAVTRGGLVAAALISRYLNIRIVDTVGIKSYKGKTRIEPEILKQVSILRVVDSKDCIVLDDLVDSGNTFQTIRKCHDRQFGLYAAVYSKPGDSCTVPHLYTRAINPKEWIKFPWEVSPIE